MRVFHISICIAGLCRCDNEDWNLQELPWWGRRVPWWGGSEWQNGAVSWEGSGEDFAQSYLFQWWSKWRLILVVNWLRLESTKPQVAGQSVEGWFIRCLKQEDPFELYLLVAVHVKWYGRTKLLLFFARLPSLSLASPFVLLLWHSLTDIKTKSFGIST